MEACGRINMQASLRRNQNPKNRSRLKLGKPATRHPWSMIRYHMAGKYGFVGESMGGVRRRNLVKVMDTGRKLDKADRDHLDHRVAG